MFWLSVVSRSFASTECFFLLIFIIAHNLPVKLSAIRERSHRRSHCGWVGRGKAKLHKHSLMPTLRYERWSAKMSIFLIDLQKSRTLSDSRLPKVQKGLHFKIMIFC